MTTCDPVSQEVGTEFTEKANKEVVPASWKAYHPFPSPLALSHASSMNHIYNTRT